MDIHPWTKYEVAAARDEERRLRAMAAYRALRGADGGAIEPAGDTRSVRSRLFDRVLRREASVAGVFPSRPTV